MLMKTIPDSRRLVDYRIKAEVDQNTHKLKNLRIIRDQRPFSIDFGLHTIRAGRSTEAWGLLFRTVPETGVKDSSGIHQYSNYLDHFLKNETSLPTRPGMLKIAAVMVVKHILLLSVPAAVVTLATVWFCPIVSVVAFGIAALAGVAAGLRLYLGMSKHLKEAQVLDFNMQSVLKGLERFRSGGGYDIDVPEVLKNDIKHINLLYFLSRSENPVYFWLWDLFHELDDPSLNRTVKIKAVPDFPYDRRRDI